MDFGLRKQSGRARGTTESVGHSMVRNAMRNLDWQYGADVNVDLNGPWNGAGILSRTVAPAFVFDIIVQWCRGGIADCGTRRSKGKNK